VVRSDDGCAGGGAVVQRCSPGPAQSSARGRVGPPPRGGSSASAGAWSPPRAAEARSARRWMTARPTWPIVGRCPPTSR